MKKTIQTRIDANGDVHLDFAGFVGCECQAEEDRLRRELASLGLKVGVKVSLKPGGNQTEANQQFGIPFHPIAG